MILERGNMWDAFGRGIFMITTNPIQRKDGAVVMGRGIALQAKTRFPQLPYDFGKILTQNFQQDTPKYAGLIGKYSIHEIPIWYFMVKSHWANNADLYIISESIKDLAETLKNPQVRVDLNFPGIGNGKLKREEVLPLLEQLPDNIHIWEYAD